MNREVVKCGLFLLGGIAIGAIGATVVSRGYDVREKVLEKVDAAREDISDVLAEALFEICSKR